MKNTDLRKQKKNELIRKIRILEKAIKARCYECMSGQKKVDCQLELCNLYRFRPWAE